MESNLNIDQKTKYSIDKLVDFVIRNGEKFEEMIMQKQQNNPEFSFLFGGPFHSYYKQKLSEAKANQKSEFSQQLKNDLFPNTVKKNEDEVPVQKVTEELDTSCYDQLIFNLAKNPTRQTVKNLRKYIFENSRNLSDFNYYCADLTQRNNEDKSFSKAISYLYVLHDAAFHCFRHSNKTEYTKYNDIVMKYLSIAFNNACEVSKTPDDKYELAKCLDMWKEYLYVNNENDDETKNNEVDQKQPENSSDTDIPYYEMPVGLMLTQVQLSDCSYQAIDSKKLILPPPQPPTDRLIAATEAFYQTPPAYRFKDGMGWEKDGLISFFQDKAPFLKLYKEKQREMNIEKLKKEVEIKIEKFANQAKESQIIADQNNSTKFTDYSP